MKIILLLTLAFLSVNFNAKAQYYSKYINEGKQFYNKTEFLSALERFDLAYEFAKTTEQKNESKNWKNKCRKKIREQQAELIHLTKRLKSQKETLIEVANVLGIEQDEKKKIFPDQISFSSYCPPVLSQGNTGSTVGWAIVNSLAILCAKELNITETSKIQKLFFSPWYIYNQITTGCHDGAHFSDGFELVKNQGVCYYNDFHKGCDVLPSHKEKELALKNRNIYIDYLKIFSIGSQNRIEPVKILMNKGYPVIIGMLCPTSIFDADSLWVPKSEDYLSNNHGAQGFVVVGYDDNKFGGAFKVMNSWGTSWGIDGYTWIKYKDFEHFTKYGYVIILDKEEIKSIIGKRAG